MVQARLREHVQHAARRAGLRVRRSEDHARHARQHDRARRTSRTARASRRATRRAAASRPASAASRSARISAWAVGSPRSSRSFGAAAISSPSLAITQPTGTSSCSIDRSASRSASRMKYSSRGKNAVLMPPTTSRRPGSARRAAARRAGRRGRPAAVRGRQRQRRAPPAPSSAGSISSLVPVDRVAQRASSGGRDSRARGAPCRRVAPVLGHQQQPLGRDRRRQSERLDAREPARPRAAGPAAGAARRTGGRSARSARPSQVVAAEHVALAGLPRSAASRWPAATSRTSTMFVAGVDDRGQTAEQVVADGRVDVSPGWSGRAARRST